MHTNTLGLRRVPLALAVASLFLFVAIFAISSPGSARATGSCNPYTEICNWPPNPWTPTVDLNLGNCCYRHDFWVVPVTLGGVPKKMTAKIGSTQIASVSSWPFIFKVDVDSLDDGQWYKLKVDVKFYGGKTASDSQWFKVCWAD